MINQFVLTCSMLTISSQSQLLEIHRWFRWFIDQLLAFNVNVKQVNLSLSLRLYSSLFNAVWPISSLIFTITWTFLWWALHLAKVGRFNGVQWLCFGHSVVDCYGSDWTMRCQLQRRSTSASALDFLIAALLLILLSAFSAIDCHFKRSTAPF